MSLCGEVEQGGQLLFHTQDNLNRDNATVTAQVHFGQATRALTVTKTPGAAYAYHFVFSQNQRGVAILEISVDGVQVPESPWRVEVIERVCFKNQMVAVSPFMAMLSPCILSNVRHHFLSNQTAERKWCMRLFQ